MDEFTPTKMVRGNRYHLWVSNHTKKHIRRRDKLFPKVKNGNSRAKSKFKGI